MNDRLRIAQEQILEQLLADYAAGRLTARKAERLLDLLRAAGRLETARDVAALEFAEEETSRMAALRRILQGKPGPRLSGPRSPAPFHMIRNAFGDEMISTLFHDLETRRDQLEVAHIYQAQPNDEGLPIIVNKQFRDGYSLRLNDKIKGMLEPHILDMATRNSKIIGINEFSLSSMSSHYGIYLNGGLARHKDRVFEPKISCVYYFWRNPKCFSGGDLVLYDDNGLAAPSLEDATLLRPENDSLIMFPSDCWHEVQPVASSHLDPLMGRLSIVFWLSGEIEGWAA